MCLYHDVIPKSCTDTLLVPIIKKKNVYDVSNYRPIGSCHSCVKIIGI